LAGQGILSALMLCPICWCRASGRRTWPPAGSFLGRIGAEGCTWRAGKSGRRRRWCLCQEAPVILLLCFSELALFTVLFTDGMRVGWADLRSAAPPPDRPGHRAYRPGL